MLTAIASYFTGRAAKAGLAALMGMLGAPGAVVGTEFATGGDIGLTLLGYVVVGAIGGLSNWAMVFFKANRATEAQISKGLY